MAFEKPYDGSGVADNARRALRARIETASGVALGEGGKARSGGVLLEAVLPRLESDPDLAKAVLLIIDRDEEALERKDRDISGAIRTWAAFEGIDVERFERRADAFRAWIAETGFIHAGAIPEDGTIESARVRGQGRHTGLADVYLGLDRYVFAGWDALPHPIAEAEETHRIAINETDKIYAVPMDIAELFRAGAPETSDDVASALKSYARNLHTLRGFKETTAEYLAALFETPDEARAALARYAGSSERIRNWRHLKSDDEGLRERMKALEKATGLLPPIAAELQVMDRAMVDRS